MVCGLGRRSAGWVQVDRYTGFCPFNGVRLVTGLLTFLHAIFIFFHSNVNEKTKHNTQVAPSLKHFRCQTTGLPTLWHTPRTKHMKTTLGGGSLGSCVDEERSQLRELM